MHSERASGFGGWHDLAGHVEVAAVTGRCACEPPHHGLDCCVSDLISRDRCTARCTFAHHPFAQSSVSSGLAMPPCPCRVARYRRNPYPATRRVPDIRRDLPIPVPVLGARDAYPKLPSARVRGARYDAQSPSLDRRHWPATEWADASMSERRSRRGGDKRV